MLPVDMSLKVGKRQLEVGDVLLLDYNQMPYEIVKIGPPTSPDSGWTSTYRMATVKDVLTLRLEARRFVNQEFVVVGGPKLLRLLADPTLVDERGRWIEPLTDEQRRDVKVSWEQVHQDRGDSP